MDHRPTTVLLVVIALACPGWAQEQNDPQEEPAQAETTSPDHTHDDEGEHQLKFYEAVEVAERADDMVGIAGSANQGTTGREDLAKTAKAAGRRPGGDGARVPSPPSTPAAARPTSISCADSTWTTAPTFRCRWPVCRSTCRPTATARATPTSTS